MSVDLGCQPPDIQKSRLNSTLPNLAKIMAAVLLLLAAPVFLGGCQSLPVRTAARQVKRAAVLQNLVVSRQLYERGRLCLLSWYDLQCIRLADLKLAVKESDGIYIYNTDAYQPSQNVNPFRQDGAGITLNYQSVDALSLSGRADFDLIASGEKTADTLLLHGVLFLSRSTPPFKRELADMKPADRHRLTAFYMKKLYDRDGQARITWPPPDGELAGVIDRRPDASMFWVLDVKSWAAEVMVVDEQTVSYQ